MDTSRRRLSSRLTFSSKYVFLAVLHVAFATFTVLALVRRYEFTWGVLFAWLVVAVGQYWSVGRLTIGCPRRHSGTRQLAPHFGTLHSAPSTYFVSPFSLKKSFCHAFTLRLCSASVVAKTWLPSLRLTK